MEEQISQQSSYLPPTPIVPPSPINQNQVAPKKKVGLVVGLVIALVMTVGVGAWGYSQYSGTKTPQIAKLTEDAGSAGYTVTQTPAEEKLGKGSIEVDGIKLGTTIDLGSVAEIIAAAGCEVVDNKLQLKGDCSPLKLSAAFTAKNTEILKKLEDTKIGDSCPSDTYIGRCSNGQGVCSNGKCILAATGTCLPGDDCPAYCTAAQLTDTTTWKEVTEPGGGKYCDDQGRECSRYRIERSDKVTWCFVDYGEQCGEPGQCGPGTNVRSPSPKPSVPASPNPSPSPTMACTGLTQTPATQPVIGSKLTFTCAGVVTPSNAGTLSYNFRYAINNGSWVNLTNKTTTTAEMTISSCGTYKVECRACATIGGLIKCDPFWQYAGVQPL